MVKFWSRLLKNWSSASWNIFLYNKFIFFYHKFIRKCYFHTTVAVKQTTAISINAFNKCNTHYNDKFLDPITLLSKSLIGLQKINKTNKKHFGGRPAKSEKYHFCHNSSVKLTTPTRNSFPQTSHWR